MAFNASGALAALADLVRTIPGQGSVIVGAPASLPNTTTAYLTVGSVEVRPMTAGTVYTSLVDLIVTFGYAVEGAPDDEETTLANAMDEFTRRVLANRTGSVTGNSVTVTRMLNTTVAGMEPPLPALGAADYVIVAGQENRIHSRAVRVRQDETIS